MDTNVNLLEEWKANEKEVSKNLAILKSRINNNAIHDIRVAIKKLRAYVQLINELDRNQCDDDLLQTKSLFDILGKHREWDITLEKLNKSTEEDKLQYPLFTKHIRQAKRQIAQPLKASIRAYNITELNEVEKRIKVLLEKKSLEEITDECRSIFKHYVNKLDNLSKHFKKEVHNVRKLLKTIFYWMNLFPGESMYTKKQLKQVDGFLDKLGDWHDLQVVSRRIKNYRDDYLSKSLDEYKALKKLSDDLKDKRDKIFQKLNPDKIIDEIKA